MKVFKFGGGILTSPNSLVTMQKVLKHYQSEKIVVVVSAFGKTTSALENLLNLAVKGNSYGYELEKIKRYYELFVNSLFPSKLHQIYSKTERLFTELNSKIVSYKDEKFDTFYDQIVSYGEVISSLIVSEYLKEHSLQNKWLDARKLIITNTQFRSAEVLDIPSIDNIRMSISLDLDTKLFIIQGFIGATDDGRFTTLGLEGSDYTAAYIAGALHVEDVIIWKDVEGIYNADPNLFNNTVKISELSYADAADMTKMGAKVLHHKTIRPLMEHKIPLEVKKFTDEKIEGTRIFDGAKMNKHIPIVVLKRNQILVTVLNKDSKDFDIEERKQLSKIFYTYEQIIGFQKLTRDKLILSVDYLKIFDKLIKELGDKFTVFYNKNLSLIVIKNYNKEVIDKVSSGRKVFHVEKDQDKVYLLLDM